MRLVSPRLVDNVIVEDKACVKKDEVRMEWVCGGVVFSGLRTVVTWLPVA
jgi:hypothetical protein